MRGPGSLRHGGPLILATGLTWTWADARALSVAGSRRRPRRAFRLRPSHQFRSGWRSLGCRCAAFDRGWSCWSGSSASFGLNWSWAWCERLACHWLCTGGCWPRWRCRGLAHRCCRRSSRWGFGCRSGICRRWAADRGTGCRLARHRLLRRRRSRSFGGLWSFGRHRRGWRWFCCHGSARCGSSWLDRGFCRWCHWSLSFLYGQDGFARRRFGWCRWLHAFLEQAADLACFCLTDGAAVAFRRNGQLFSGIKHVLVVQAKVLGQLINSDFAAAGHSGLRSVRARSASGPQTSWGQCSSCLSGCLSERRAAPATWR